MTGSLRSLPVKKPKPKKLPGYLHHKGTGQARVRLDGVDHYLGQYGSSLLGKLRLSTPLTKYLISGPPLIAAVVWGEFQVPEGSSMEGGQWRSRARDAMRSL